MWEGLGELLAHFFGYVAELLDRPPKLPKLEECLRCGYPHEGVRCPKCRYVFRIKPARQ